MSLPEVMGPGFLIFFFDEYVGVGTGGPQIPFDPTISITPSVIPDDTDDEDTVAIAFSLLLLGKCCK